MEKKWLSRIGLSGILILMAIFFYSCPDDDTDIFESVKIGDQVWMTKNLDIASGNSWYPRYQYLVEGKEVIVTHNEYGRLYDWETAINVCPTGWHLPSEDEWDQLIDHLGGMLVAGGKLKNTLTRTEGIHVLTPDDHPGWFYPNEAASNSSGFSALPAGFAYPDGSCHDAGLNGFWWTSTDVRESAAKARGMHYTYASVFSSIPDKVNGYSVRCVKD